MQELLDVDQPDHGPILSGMVVPDGGAIAASELIQPRVEAEVAFVLGEPLQGPGLTAIDVLGVRMEPGHVVMPGALHAAVPVAAGDVFTASFDRLGTVTVRFV